MTGNILKKTEDEKALATPEDAKHPAVLRNLDVLKLILKSTLCDFKGEKLDKGKYAGFLKR